MMIKKEFNVGYLALVVVIVFTLFGLGIGVREYISSCQDGYFEVMPPLSQED